MGTHYFQQQSQINLSSNKIMKKNISTKQRNKSANIGFQQKEKKLIYFQLLKMDFYNDKDEFNHSFRSYFFMTFFFLMKNHSLNFINVYPGESLEKSYNGMEVGKH